MVICKGILFIEKLLITITTLGSHIMESYNRSSALAVTNQRTTITNQELASKQDVREHAGVYDSSPILH